MKLSIAHLAASMKTDGSIFVEIQMVLRLPAD